MGGATRARRGYAGKVRSATWCAWVSAAGTSLIVACVLPGIDLTGAPPPGGQAGSGGQGSGGQPNCSLPADTPGDCLQAVCDAEGGVSTVDDDDDVPTVGECVIATCAGGTLTEANAPDGAMCGAAGAGLTCESGVCQGCATPADCGPPPECNVYECDEPGPSGACVLAPEPSTIVCGGGTYCSDDVHLASEHCDGTGRCVTTSTSCDPSRCEEGACTMGCTVQGDCAPGATCESASGGCQDCITCSEFLASSDPDGGFCGQKLFQSLQTCGCDPNNCLNSCNRSLCEGMTPVGNGPCYNCLLNNCPTELGDCQGDVDPYP